MANLEGEEEMMRYTLGLLVLSMCTYGADWQQSRGEDALTGKTYTRFELIGAPLRTATVSTDVPRLVLLCDGGHLISGEFRSGLVVQPAGTHSIKGRPQAHVQFRHTGEAKMHDAWWEYSNDGTVLFFDKRQFDEILTGKLLGHPSTDPIKPAVRIGVVEETSNMTVTEFVLPQDNSAVVNACGLEWGRAKKH